MKNVQINNLVEYWEGQLGRLAQELINEYLLEQQNQIISSDPGIPVELGKEMIELNERFYLEYDDPYHHAPMWHQYGILTHTLKVRESYYRETELIMHGWGMSDMWRKWCEERIDSVRKFDLMDLAILFHDLGKFAGRKMNYRQGGIKFDFDDHERLSGEIIRQKIRPKLLADGLTEPMIKYVEDVAGLHYLLGDMRGIGRKSRWGYTLEYLASGFFRLVLEKVILGRRDYCREVGIFFLIDSLGKLSMRVMEGDIDEYKRAMSEIDQLNLPTELINSVDQLIVNLEAARIYFAKIKRLLK